MFKLEHIEMTAILGMKSIKLQLFNFLQKWSLKYCIINAEGFMRTLG